MSVFDGKSPTHTPQPLPPIMYITFAGAWFMQILICISLLNVLSAGWNPLKPIVNTALHQILIVTFSLFYLLFIWLLVFEVHTWTTNKIKKIFYGATLTFHCFGLLMEICFLRYLLFLLFWSLYVNILDKRFSTTLHERISNVSLKLSLGFGQSSGQNLLKISMKPPNLNWLRLNYEYLSVWGLSLRSHLVWVYLKPCTNIKFLYLSGLLWVIFFNAVYLKM